MQAATLFFRKPTYMNTQILLFSIFFTVLRIVETYVFRDWEFVKWVIVLLVIDTILGMIHAWRQQNFSSRGFSQIIPKAAIYGAALVVTNVLQYFTIKGVHVEAFDWLAHLILVGIILREAISVLENCAKIDNRILPAWILRSLKSMEKNMEAKADDAPSTDRPK